MQNLGSSLGWQRHADALAAVDDDGAVRLHPARRVRHLEAVVAVGAERPCCWWHPAHCDGRDLALDGDVDLLRRRAADVADVAVVGQLLAVVAARADRHLVLRHARHLELRARVADVGVAGDALVAGLAQARVVDADVVEHLVALDLRLGVALHAVVGAHDGGERPLVGVGDVQDEVGDALQVADEVVEHAGLGVALLAADAGAVVRRLLVGGHLGLDDVARGARVDAVDGREPMTATMTTTTSATSTPSSHGRGTLTSRSTWLLGSGFLITAHSLPGVGVAVGVTRGAGVYLTPSNRLCARGSPAACCSWQAWQLSSTWQLKQVGVPERAACSRMARDEVRPDAASAPGGRSCSTPWCCGTARTTCAP